MHYILKKGLTQQEYITIINICIYAYITLDSKTYEAKLTKLKGEIDSFTIIAGDYKT